MTEDARALPQAPGAPRVPPGDRERIGRVNAALTWVIGRAAGTAGPPHVFATLARDRGLFRRWLLFAGGLMPGGKLPREDTELVILRVAHLCDCAYEWDHHVRIGRRAGVTGEDADRVRQGPDAAGWSPRHAALLRAVDELHADRLVSDATWALLDTFLDERELIEFCLLVGHYEMLAMTIRSLGVQRDTFKKRR
jgi:AhpD family alkylhydroperoxidase